MVRTDERLAEYFGDRNILRKSQYYNDWMRPQELDHTMGTTVLAERGVVANLSLLNSADVGGFRVDELQSFKRICCHLRRAIRVAMRLETVAAQGNTALEALDCLPYGAIFLDLPGRLLSCNAIAEALLRTGDGLSVRGAAGWSRSITASSASSGRSCGSSRAIRPPATTGARRISPSIERRTRIRWS